jgi:hypothetical protein
MNCHELNWNSPSFLSPSWEKGREGKESEGGGNWEQGRTSIKTHCSKGEVADPDAD